MFSYIYNMTMTFTAWDPKLDSFLDAGDFEGLRAARPANMTAVEANFHNAGGMDVLRLLGLEADFSGRVALADLPAVRRAIIRARNQEGRRVPFLYEAVSVGRHHFGGQSDGQIMSRIDRLDEVVTHCLDNGFDLSWG